MFLLKGRCKLIKLVDSFKTNRTIVFIAGLLLIVALGGMFFLRGLSGNNLPQGPAAYNSEILFKYKNTYVGDNSKVVTIIDNLPYANLRGEVSLQTTAAPYGITVNYHFDGVNEDVQQIKWILSNNAAAMFALIDNANFTAAG